MYLSANTGAGFHIWRQRFPDGTPEQHKWFNELERISTSPHNAGRFMRVFNAIDVTGQLPLVKCPTLVLHSTRDARVPFVEGDRSHRERAGE